MTSVEATWILGKAVRTKCSTSWSTFEDSCTDSLRHAEVEGNDRADRLAGKAIITSGWRLGRSKVSRSLRLYPQKTKPWTLHHRSSGGERRKRRQRSTIFVERARQGHHQLDQHWNYFRGNTEESSERQGGAHMDLPGRVNTILNWNEQNCKRQSDILQPLKYMCG